jgi:hypothetical protein
VDDSGSRENGAPLNTAQERRTEMEPTMIVRIVAGALAVLAVAVIILRRKRKTT